MEKCQMCGRKFASMNGIGHGTFGGWSFWANHKGIRLLHFFRQGMFLLGIINVKAKDLENAEASMDDSASEDAASHLIPSKQSH